MTTKVVIACPDNSVHDALVWVEDLDGETWVREGEPVVVKPHETAEPIYVTANQRVVIEEAPRGDREAA